MNNNLKSIFNQSFKEANENFEQYESLKDFLLSELSFYSMKEKIKWLEKVSKGGLSSGEVISCFASYSPQSVFFSCPDDIQNILNDFSISLCQLSEKANSFEDLTRLMVFEAYELTAAKYLTEILKNKEAKEIYDDILNERAINEALSKLPTVSEFAYCQNIDGQKRLIFKTSLADLIERCCREVNPDAVEGLYVKIDLAQNCSKKEFKLELRNENGEILAAFADGKTTPHICKDTLKKINLNAAWQDSIAPIADSISACDIVFNHVIYDIERVFKQADTRYDYKTERTIALDWVSPWLN